MCRRGKQGAARNDCEYKHATTLMCNIETHSFSFFISSSRRRRRGRPRNSNCQFAKRNRRKIVTGEIIAQTCSNSVARSLPPSCACGCASKTPARRRPHRLFGVGAAFAPKSKRSQHKQSRSAMCEHADSCYEEQFTSWKFPPTT